MVPSFLRPAELSWWGRVKLHPLFKHWPNIGYIISAVSVLVTDMLWLRSLFIVANCFGILVNRSFNFWTGIYWNLFFILANLVQIALILNERRAVSMSQDERGLYELVFAEAFTPQEFRKLLKAGEWRTVQVGEQLMTQGQEIDSVYLIDTAMCRAEEERRTPIDRGEQTQATAGNASPAAAALGTALASPAALLSKLFGSAHDGSAHSADEATPPAPAALATSPTHSSHGDDVPFGVDSTRVGSAPHTSAASPVLSTSLASVPPSLPAPAEPVLSAVVHHVADNVRELLHGLHHAQQPHEPPQANTSTASQLQSLHPPAEPRNAAAPLSPSPASPPLADHGSAADAVDASPPSAAPLPSSLSQPPLSSSAPALPLSDARERRRAERRAKREKRRKERTASVAQLQGAPLAAAAADASSPSTSTSATTSAISSDGLYEVRKEVIGYMRGGRMVGEMSVLLTSPTQQPQTTPTAAALTPLADSSLPPHDRRVATATVTCVEAGRVLAWKKDSLRSLFLRFPSLYVGWYAVVSSDLLHRLSESQRLARRNGYKLLLLGICCEQQLTAKQRSAADEYRRIHSIGEEEHVQALRDLGWTPQDWERGSKRLGWMEQITHFTQRRASI